MFLNKFFHFLRGYVILIVTGFNIERFLYICTKRNIDVWDIDKQENLQISMSISDFFKIRSVVRKTKVKVHIKKKMGLPIILKKYKKRYFMFSGCILFLLVMILSSQFIWSVEITGVKNADITEIREILEDSGVYVGAFKGKSKSAKEIKNILLNRVDNISWAWVYLKGTKAVCVVYEDSVPVKALEDGEPCNVVASRDGIIKRIIARNGIRKVASGETVLKGDVLISGELPDDAGNVGCVVEATGIIEAYTWHEETDTYKLYYETHIPTGRKKVYNRLNIFSKQFNLFLKRDDGYENYISDVRKKELKILKDKYIGISLEREYVHEVEVIKEIIPYDMAVHEGQSDLEERIAKELMPGAELISEEVSHRRIDDETVEVTVTMGFVEKIGEKAPITVK